MKNRRRLRQPGRDKGGWQVQLVGGGAAGGGKDVSVGGGLWKQHDPIIMGSLGEKLLSIEPAALADALGDADVLGAPSAAGCDGCHGCKACAAGDGCAADDCSGPGCKACADAAGGAGSSRLFFFAYSVAQTVAKRGRMIRRYRDEEEAEKKKREEEGLGAAVVGGGDDPLARAWAGKGVEPVQYSSPD